MNENDNTEKIKDKMFAKDIFKAKDKDGNIKDFYVVLKFDSNETGKSYVIYTDKTTNENGEVELLSSSYTIENNILKLSPIETKKEWLYVSLVLKMAQDEEKYD